MINVLCKLALAYIYQNKAECIKVSVTWMHISLKHGSNTTAVHFAVLLLLAKLKYCETLAMLMM